MKARLVELGPNMEGLIFWCPGCEHAHMISTSSWQWNGSEDAPTITPSILVHSHPQFDDDGNRIDTPDCHSYVTDGQIQFLEDSTHALAGQTVALPDWPPL